VTRIRYRIEMWVSRPLEWLLEKLEFRRRRKEANRWR